MAVIDSEVRFIWRILLDILLLPITLIQVLMGRKEASALVKPLSDAGAFFLQPKCTVALIVVNVGVFLITLLLGPEKVAPFVHFPTNILDAGKLYTIITAGFLHQNLTHLGLNMLALFIFGRIVERKLGILKMAMVYFGALVISMVFHSGIYLLMGENVGGVGASGAIMGLVSTAMLIDPLYVTFELIIPLPVMVVGWLTIILDLVGVLNPVPGVGHLAHLGGFFSIALIMYLLPSSNRAQLKMGLVVNMISLAIGLTLYFGLRFI